MSIGSLGIVGGLAGTSLPQRAAEADKTQRETTEQTRAAQAAERAEQAAGIGEAEEDSQTSERDADGRRPWEESVHAKKKEAVVPAAEEAAFARAKDPSGERGGELDVVG
jgi:hypothetical protein